ncbi:CSN-associated deubiquitinating enzyme Ubp12, partial [Tulasnella sp. 427]
SYNPPGPKTYEMSKTATLKTLEETYIQPMLKQAHLTTHPFRVWKIDSTSIDEDLDDGPAENEGYTPVLITKQNPTPLFGSSASPFDPRTTTLEEAMVSHGDRLIVECQFGSAWNVSVSWPRAAKRAGAVSPEGGPSPPPGFGKEAQAQAPLFGSGSDFFSSLEASQAKTSEANRITPGFTRNEVKKPNGTTFAGSSLSMVRSKSYPPKARGTTGLNNLGNTCFMNSALQCLAHLPELTEYFLTGVYVSELNPDNPLSTKGDLARSYGSLLGNLFDETDNAPYSVAPRDFKIKISRHAPSFSGYAQHDTQELLAVSMNRNSTIKDLKVLLGKWFKMDPEKILATEIFQFKFYKFFSDYLPVSEVLDADTIFFYELPIATEQSVANKKPSPDDPFIVPVHTVSEPTFYTGYSRTRFSTGKHLEAFGFPFFVAISKEEAKDTEKIYARVVERYEQATNRARDLYRWFPVGKDEDEDAVMVAAPQSENSDGSGEMIEAKDAEGDPKPEDAEGDPKPEDETKAAAKPAGEEDEDDLEEVQLPDYKEAAADSPPTPASEDEVVRGPPKPELFNWWIQGKNWEAPPGGSNGSQWDTGYVVNERTRKLEEDITTKDGTIHYEGCIRPRDAIVCEWETNLKTYFFGVNGVGPESRWNATEDYVDPEQAAQTKARVAKSKSGVTLEDCLDEFVKEEKLGEQDPWYCPRCKKHQQATKKFDIWKVPDILVVHLKRFSNSRMLRDKIDVLVDFPIEGLDLEGRVEQKIVAHRLAEEGLDVQSLGVGDPNEPLLYDLFAVDEHMGGLGGGHYRAYAKNTDDNKWYHFDDSRVDSTTASASVTSYAYLLFYRRRTTKPIGGQTLEKIEEAKKFPPQRAPEPEPVQVPLVPTSRAVVLRPATPNTGLQALGPHSGDITPVTTPRSSPPSLDDDRPFGPDPWITGTGFRQQYGSDLDGTPSSFASQNDHFAPFSWDQSDDRQGDDSATGLPSPNVSDDGVDIGGARANVIQVDEDYDGQDPFVDEITVDDKERLT